MSDENFKNMIQKQRNRSNKERKYLHPVLGPMNLSTLPVKDIKGELTMI